jgi:peptidoglycan/xylan/chitin deacetylase (PgdA/CDA1 family)
VQVASEGHPVLLKVGVSEVRDCDRLGWSEGMSFRLPEAALGESDLLGGLRRDGTVAIIGPPHPCVAQHFQDLRLRAAFTKRRPASSRLPISYQRIPAWARSAYASALGRWKRAAVDRWAAFPQWPLDLSADFLADLASDRPSPFLGGPTPVLLSHDLDSAEGLSNLVRWFVEVEESVGARSTNYIVPCGFSIDHDLLGEVKARGHEVGVHGYDHSNTTAFADAVERRRRIDAAAPLRERYGAEGYRAPSLLRTPGLLRDLAAFYRYDSSIPTSGGLFPIPNNGCASARPFVVEGIAEIPLSMPRDGSLRFLGYSPGQIADLWVDCARQIARSGGVVVILTHCERQFSGNPPMIAAYRRFLEFVAGSDQFAWSTPSEVLARGVRA